jgi:two-component system CheB/CheR fusion protein
MAGEEKNNQSRRRKHSGESPGAREPPGNPPEAADGMIVAQEEEQAKYDSMPHSAVETGMVDFTLPVEKMGEQLIQYVQHPFLAQRRVPEPEPQTLVEDLLEKVFLSIRRETGHDFSHYKRNTIQRRIARRMAVHQVEDLSTYVRLLHENPEEVRTLVRELLITVTSFFRDPEAFEALKNEVIRPLVESKPLHAPIRVWVAGCATGEEAYRVAMLLDEQMSQTAKRYSVQIFATDLDEDSLNTARRGTYPRSIAGGIPQAMLQRYFTEENSGYRVRTAIREMLVFAKHNLVKDAPFSKLDLVCCRNVLIYMDTTLQKKIIPMFHYTLNPGGHLFLGESESVGVHSDLFAPVDVRRKIFRRKPTRTDYEPALAITTYAQTEGSGDQEKEKAHPPRALHELSRFAEKVILRDYSLPCVLVNKDFDTLYFNGDTSRYLALPSGHPTFNIVQMTRPEIHYQLNLLLKQAFHEKQMMVQKDVQIRVNDHYEIVDLIVRPISENGMSGSLALVVFKAGPRKEGVENIPNPAPPTGSPEGEKDGKIRVLEQDLQSTKEYLQTTIEELDTSREELQSANEELRTVNSEHQQKIDELSKSYDDLNNLPAAEEVSERRQKQETE